MDADGTRGFPQGARATRPRLETRLGGAAGGRRRARRLRGREESCTGAYLGRGTRHEREVREWRAARNGENETSNFCCCCFFFFGSRARFLGLLHADVSPGPPRASFSPIRMKRPGLHRKREGQARFGGGFARNRPRGKHIFSRQSRKEKEGKKSASDALRQRATRERREPHRPSKDFLPLALILNDV